VQFGPFILPAPAFVAYRHPCAYKVLAGGFFVVADTIYIGLQIFDAGAFVMFHAMRSYIDQEKLRAAMGIRSARCCEEDPVSDETGSAPPERLGTALYS
jgi:hypothetical protein